MKFSTITVILLILSFNDLFSQNLKGKRIDLRANTSVSGDLYFMETTCSGKDVKIKFKIKDSVDMEKLNADSNYSAIRRYILETKPFNSKNEAWITRIEQSDSIRLSYTAFHVDSITISYNRYPEYKKLLDTLFSSSKSELENKISNNNRMVLDGTSMTFRFFDKEKLRFVAYTQSPDQISHPLIYNYMRSTMAIYKKEQKNDFLNKYRTNRY
jgi:hypothetical protein